MRSAGDAADARVSGASRLGGFVASRYQQFWRIRFYVLGLALQKGLPILVAPLVVAAFGRDVFGEYVLVYTVIQIYGNVSALSVPQTVVPIWFRQADPAKFVALCYAMVLGLSAAFGAVAGAILLFAPPHLALSLPIMEACGWIMCFALFYNLNQLAVGIARSEDRQRHFFWATVVGGVVLVAGILAAHRLGFPGLRGLIIAQLLSVAVSTLVLLGPRIFAVGKIDFATLREQAPPILRFSLPLAGYSLLVLLSMSIDKWMASAWFPRDVFNAYVLEYQFAFAMMFIPTAISLYSGSRVSALVAAGDREGLKIEENRAKGLALLGSSGVAVAMYCYAWATGLPMGPGYWVLALGFIFEGQYVIRSNRLMAEMRSTRLLMITLGSVLLYALLLLAAGLGNSVMLLYASPPLYLGLMLLLISHPGAAALSESAKS